MNVLYNPDVAYDMETWSNTIGEYESIRNHIKRGSNLDDDHLSMLRVINSIDLYNLELQSTYDDIKKIARKRKLKFEKLKQIQLSHLNKYKEKYPEYFL